LANIWLKIGYFEPKSKILSFLVENLDQLLGQFLAQTMIQFHRSWPFIGNMSYLRGYIAITFNRAIPNLSQFLPKPGSNLAQNRAILGSQLRVRFSGQSGLFWHQLKATKLRYLHELMLLNRMYTYKQPQTSSYLRDFWSIFNDF